MTRADESLEPIGHALFAVTNWEPDNKTREHMDMDAARRAILKALSLRPDGHGYEELSVEGCSFNSLTAPDEKGGA